MGDSSPMRLTVRSRAWSPAARIWDRSIKRDARARARGSIASLRRAGDFFSASRDCVSNLMALAPSIAIVGVRCSSYTPALPAGITHSAIAASPDWTVVISTSVTVSPRARSIGCHASLIFGVWLICTIQGPKDFRASMYARHGPQALLRPAADGDGARILVRSARAARRRRAREGLVR